MHCRWHISQGAFIAAWPLKSESCWVRGELAHTCITEEGTPVHPAAWTRRVDPANPGVKADQRTGPKSSAAPTTLLVFLYQKKTKQLHLLIFGASVMQENSGKTQRVKEEISRGFHELSVFSLIRQNFRLILRKTNMLPASLFVSGQRKKMEYKNGASKHGKVLTADNHRYWPCRQSIDN